MKWIWIYVLRKMLISRTNREFIICLFLHLQLYNQWSSQIEELLIEEPASWFWGLGVLIDGSWAGFFCTAFWADWELSSARLLRCGVNSLQNEEAASNRCLFSYDIIWNRTFCLPPHCRHNCRRNKPLKSTCHFYH